MKAFNWLDQAIDRRFGPMIYLKVNPIWDPLRSDPRLRNGCGAWIVAVARRGLQN